jgi:hypothetical protein
VHVLDAAEDVARPAVLLLKLGLVSRDVYSADGQLDPILGVSSSVTAVPFSSTLVSPARRETAHTSPTRAAKPAAVMEGFI